MKDSKFNAAEPIAMNKDMLFQAHQLTRRMKVGKDVISATTGKCE
jgi:hypothetical protein